MLRCTALIDGQPVGFAIWHSPIDRTATGGDPTDEEKASAAARDAELEASKEDMDREYEAQFDLPAQKALKKAMMGGRKHRYGGRPYWLLEYLVVQPEAQGLGVGKALLAWGFERADKDKLPIYLEATPAGRLLYERTNFKVVGNIVMELDRPGPELSLPTMERPPQPTVAAPKADDVVLSLVEDADWPEVIRTKLLAMVGDPLYETSAPVHRRPDFETQLSV